MSADPLTLGIGGALVGGMMDKENPLRGAALGGAGGYFGGPLFNAAETAAPGMAGATGSGISGSIASPTAVGGMSNVGALGSGVGGASPMAMAGGEPLKAGGMASLGAEGAGATGSLAYNPAQGLLADKMANKGMEMGAQMLMKNKQAQQGQPVMPGVAPPMMRPQFQGSPFLASAPQFHPVFGMAQNRNIAPNRRG